MKNTKKIALFNPYLDVLGGGEKYILLILKIFDDLDYKIDIFWNENLSEKIKQRFNLEFKNLNFRLIAFKNYSFFSKIFILKNYDLLFYITDGSYFFSTAKKNYIYAMIPDKKLYQLTILNRLKTANFCFFTHSLFNQKLLKKWGINTFVLYPYIDDVFLLNDKTKKEKIILSVGRFFSHLHSKNQQKIIQAFNKLKKIDKSFLNYKLILTGGLREEDKEYFNHLKSLSKNDPYIIFKPNLSFKELCKIYKTATYFWHFTGYLQDEEKNPQKVEHLGITPLEAMASKNIVFCYRAGGPKELIKDGINGFTFNHEDELIKKLIAINKNKNLLEKIRNNGVNFIKKNFSYQDFKKKVVDFFL